MIPKCGNISFGHQSLIPSLVGDRWLEQLYMREDIATGLEDLLYKGVIIRGPKCPLNTFLIQRGYLKSSSPLHMDLSPRCKSITFRLLNGFFQLRYVDADDLWLALERYSLSPRRCRRLAQSTLVNLV